LKELNTLLVAKLGSTYSWLSEQIGDFENWITDSLQAFTGNIIIASPGSDRSLPSVNTIDGTILTGSHSMVTTREPWSEDMMFWLMEALRHNKPLLGICYGHQLLAQAAGGTVDYNRHGREFGTARVHLHEESRNDPLFKELPSPLAVHVCHAQSVIELPPKAFLLASNTHDPHHAFRIGHNAWGVQFHPEFPPAATRAYIEHHSDELLAEGLDPGKLLHGVHDTPEARSILRRFAEFVEESSGQAL
jgi:GMP synthase (glutamine-hydrolysing)